MATTGMKLRKNVSNNVIINCMKNSASLHYKLRYKNFNMRLGGHDILFKENVY